MCGGMDGRHGLVGHVGENVVPLCGDFVLLQDEFLLFHNCLNLVINCLSIVLKRKEVCRKNGRPLCVVIVFTHGLTTHDFLNPEQRHQYVKLFEVIILRFLRFRLQIYIFSLNLPNKMKENLFILYVFVILHPKSGRWTVK
jgi:hypothetical protein